MEQIATEPISLVNRDYRVQLSDRLNDPDWDAFLKTVPGGSYQQTSLWARAKSFFRLRPARIVIKHGEIIVGGAQVLIRRMSPLGAVGYVTRGPVIASGHSALAGAIIEELHRLARKERIRCLAVQLPAGDDVLTSQMSEWEACPDSLSLAPVATVRVDLSQDLDAITSGMRKTTRYCVRSGAKKGVMVRLGTENDLDSFHRLALITGERQEFSTEPLEYYRHIWRALAPGNNLKLFLAEVNGEAVSAAIMIAFGDSVTFWRSGWSGSHDGHHPNEAVQWAAIKWARENGYRWYDLGGIGPRTAVILQRREALPDLPEYRAYLFKIGFGGEVAVFPKASLYVYSPLLRWFYRRARQTNSASPMVTRVIRLFS